MLYSDVFSLHQGVFQALDRGDLSEASKVLERELPSLTCYLQPFLEYGIQIEILPLLVVVSSK